jgi:hypothetical protein
MGASTLQFVLCPAYSAVEEITLFRDQKLETATACHRSNSKVAVGNSSTVIDADNTTFYRSESRQQNPRCELTITAILPARSIVTVCTTRDTAQRSIGGVRRLTVKNGAVLSKSSFDNNHTTITAITLQATRFLVGPVFPPKRAPH